MKLKELESELQPLSGFHEPKRELEQYVTSPHLAARMIYTAESSFGDIDDKDILDLGCGCAILSIASVMMGANSVMSVDMDPDALAIARENIAQVEMEDEIQLVHAQISSGAPVEKREGEVEMFCPGSLVRKFDTVIMNPPFGSWTKGIDMVFLETACQIAETAVYSLHKSSTREFILRKATTLGFSGEVLAEMRYDLPKTMAFHKSKSVDIQVDFFRFVRVKPKSG